MIDVGTLNAWGGGLGLVHGPEPVDASVLLVVLALVWLPMRRKMSAQFAHGLFLLVLLKVVVPVPVSWPSWSAGATIGRAALWSPPGPWPIRPPRLRRRPR